MNVSNIFSARNITLFVFILIVLFLGATFDVQIKSESFGVMDTVSNLMNGNTQGPSATTKPQGPSPTLKK